jgi:hypothetical protein
VFFALKDIISIHPLFFVLLFVIPFISENIIELIVYPLFHLGRLFSTIQKFIVLTLVYFSIFFPISLIYKFLNRKKEIYETKWKVVDKQKKINFKNLW